MNDDASPENLRKFLESDDPALVRMGISLAKGMGVEVTVKDLEHFLKSEDGETIKTGFMLAEEAGVGDEVIELLCERLADDDYDVKYCAAKVLGEIGEPAVEPIMGALHPLLWPLEDVQIGMDALDLAEEAGVLEMAIDCICEQMDTAGGNERVRFLAAAVFEESGRESAKAETALIKALKDGDGAVCERAAYALDGFGWEPDTDELRVVYLLAKYDTEAFVKWGKLAVEPLIKALKEGKASPSGCAAANALGEIGDSRAVEPLITALGDWDHKVRGNAAEALGKIGKPAVEPLIEALGDDISRVRASAAEALGKIGDARAIELLIKALGDEDEEVRRGAAYALRMMGDARAVEPLIKALKDNDWLVQMHAANALGKIGDTRAVEPLIKALSDELSDDEEWIRDAAKEALKKLGHEVE